MTDIREEIDKLGVVSDNWAVLREILRQIVDVIMPKKGKK